MSSERVHTHVLQLWYGLDVAERAHKLLLQHTTSRVRWHHNFYLHGISSWWRRILAATLVSTALLMSGARVPYEPHQPPRLMKHYKSSALHQRRHPRIPQVHTRPAETIK